MIWVFQTKRKKDNCNILDNLTRAIEEYRKSAIRVAMRYVDRVDDAEDVVGKAVLKCYQTCRQMATYKEAVRYFFIAVKTCAIDFLRSNNKHKEYQFGDVSNIFNDYTDEERDSVSGYSRKEMDVIGYVESPDEILSKDQLSDESTRVLNSMDAIYKGILIDFCINDMDLYECSLKYKITEDTIKTRYSRAKRIAFVKFAKEKRKCDCY